MAPKKNKMSLNEFLGDGEFGPSPGSSWADDDMPIPGPAEFTDPTNQSWTANKRDFPPHGGPPARGDRPPREPREPVPIPDSPPFTARFGNLSFDVREDDLKELLTEFKVVTIRLPMDVGGRSRGVAFVEFEDRASLEDALKLSDNDFRGRQLRVMVAEKSSTSTEDEKFNSDWRSARKGPLPPRDEGDERRGGPPSRREEPEDHRDYDNWARRGPLPPLDESRGRNHSGRGGRGGSARGGGSPRNRSSDASDSVSTWRKPADSPSQPRGKPKISLAPRTVGAKDAAAPPPPASGSGSSIFGGAKPVDTQKKLLEVEEKQRKMEQEKLSSGRSHHSSKPQQKSQQHDNNNSNEESTDATTEQVRQRFDVLSTENDEDDKSKAAQNVSETKPEAQATEAEKVQSSSASKEELEGEDWEVVQRKK